MIRGDTILFVYALAGLAIGIWAGYNWKSFFSHNEGGTDDERP